jgi:hypothetical protein
MIRVRICGIALLTLLVVVAPVRGQTADVAPVSVTLVQPEALPFSDAELQQALLARLPAAAAETELPPAAVEPADVGAVAVHVGRRSRVIVVGERTGAAAARVVALVIAELLSANAQPDDARTPAAGTPAAEAPSVVPTGVVATGAPSASIAAGASTPAPEPDWTPRLCVTAGAAKGTSADEPWAGTLDADLVMAIGSGRLRLAPSAGLTVMPPRNGGTVDEVSFVGVSVRALVGASFGPVDVLGGPVVSPYSIGGAVSHLGVLVGGEAMTRLTVALWDQVRFVADVRVDAFADRARVHFIGGQLYATPRVGIAAGVGLAWDWTP